MKFSKSFKRDYEFYVKNKNIFTFSGSASPNITYNAAGNNAKKCFYLLDSQGKHTDCSEPELLIELLNCKAAVNLQIKMWAEGRAEYTLSKSELEEYMEFYNCPDWVMNAVENQKEKILKGSDNKFKRQNYIFHLGELE